ncbi:GxxExxY protein [endosymbiont of Lamellibrachia barhami]|uniref:GxxExxY protein n=1 Tax=endosymbiont of Lamellibrachia barhami TaxID=205975 RepID=UPI0015AE8A70|nr:GxxExxY protein [endosymbiont of Lamellibrachia barhami]
MDIEKSGRQVVDSAVKVHREMGPGLLEKTYETCLEYELRKRNIPTARQVELPVVYDGLKLDGGYRIDLLVDQMIVIEIKAVRLLSEIHDAQLLNYLKLGDFRLGYLLNFNVRRMKFGIKRMVNNL